MANLIAQLTDRIGTRNSNGVGLTIREIPVGDIVIRENVRKEFSGIEELAASIKQHGLIAPITVYRNGDAYVVKIGHRRFKAFQYLYGREPDRFHSIRCIISTSDNIAVVQLVENIQREDLSPIDLCNALTALRGQGMSNQEIADAMGKSVGYVNNLFSAVNEVNTNPNLAEKTHAGVSLQDIAETKGIQDEQARLDLLEQRKNGKINRAELREKARELKDTKTSSITPEIAVEEEPPTVKIVMSDDGLTISLVFSNNTPVQNVRNGIEKLMKANGIKIV